MSIRKHVSFMLYLFSSFDGIIINITTDILNESYRINKTVAFFRLFKLLLHTRAQFFFTAAKPIVNFFVDSFIYLFIHFPISSRVRHNFPRLRTNDCGIKTEISLTDVYETQTSSLFCLEARSGEAASAAIYDTLLYRVFISIYPQS
jgi:hypothetical protein